jgi:hypothetical protein
MFGYPGFGEVYRVDIPDTTGTQGRPDAFEPILLIGLNLSYFSA